MQQPFIVHAQISVASQLIIKNILKDNAQISVAGQLIIKNILTFADGQSIFDQDGSTTSNHLVVNNEGLLHSKDVLNISANTLNNEMIKDRLTIGKG
jgi:hypothetical protein